MIRALLLLLISCNLFAMESAPVTQEALNAKVLEKFQEIVRFYWDQREKAQSDNNVLNNGYWYAVDYFVLLKKWEKTQTIDSLKEGDAFIGSLKEFPNWTEAFFTMDTPENLYEYYLKEGLKPSEVLNNLETSGVLFIDCSIAYQIAFYRAILALWGQEKFDMAFQSREKPFFGISTLKTILGDYVETTVVKIAGQPGTHFYIKNNFLYCSKEKCGHAEGYNLIVLKNNPPEETLFLGLGLNPDGETVDGIAKNLIDNFNQTPFNQQLVSQAAWQKRKPVKDEIILSTALKNIKATSLDNGDIIFKLHRWFEDKKNNLDSSSAAIKEYVRKKQCEQEKIPLWQANLSLEKLLKAL